MLVFGVKYRLGLILPEAKDHIHAMLAKLVNEHGKGSHAIKVGGTKDHVHILFSLSPNIALKDLVREIKSRSSRWINENRMSVGRFEWQNGYGAFSYSQSARGSVINYIENQEEHHRILTFKEELVKFLELYGIVSDPRDLPKGPQ